jgi:hypothetical protein
MEEATIIPTSELLVPASPERKGPSALEESLRDTYRSHSPDKSERVEELFDV